MIVIQVMISAVDFDCAQCIPMLTADLCYRFVCLQYLNRKKNARSLDIGNFLAMFARLFYCILFADLFTGCSAVW